MRWTRHATSYKERRYLEPEIEASILKRELDGVLYASVSVHGFSGEQLTVSHSGAGPVSIGGTVLEQHVRLSGAGNYDGAALVSERATVDLSGFGSVVVNVSTQRCMPIHT